MKKILCCLAICCLCLCGCGKEKTKDTVEAEMSKEEIIEKLMEVNNWLTTIWNDGICDISHYLENGTNSVGESMDINHTIELLNDNYKKKDEYMKFVDSLGNEYGLIKSSFTKAIEQANIVVEKVNETIPEANTEPNYKENIELFNQYQSTFYEKVTEIYYED